MISTIPFAVLESTHYESWVKSYVAYHWEAFSVLAYVDIGIICFLRRSRTKSLGDFRWQHLCEA